MIVKYDEDNFSIKLYRDFVKGKLVGLMEVIPIDELLEVWEKHKAKQTENSSEKPNNSKVSKIPTGSEPQTERLCDNCEYYGGGEVCDHPSIGEVEMGGKGDTFPWIKETPKWCPLKDEPQTERSE